MRIHNTIKFNKLTIHIVCPIITCHTPIYIGRGIGVAITILYKSLPYTFYRINKYSISCKGNFDCIRIFIIPSVIFFCTPKIIGIIWVSNINERILNLLKAIQ